MKPLKIIAPLTCFLIGVVALVVGLITLNPGAIFSGAVTLGSLAALVLLDRGQTQDSADSLPAASVQGLPQHAVEALRRAREGYLSDSSPDALLTFLQAVDDIELSPPPDAVWAARHALDRETAAAYNRMRKPPRPQRHGEAYDDRPSIRRERAQIANEWDAVARIPATPGTAERLRGLRSRYAYLTDLLSVQPQPGDPASSLETLLASGERPAKPRYSTRDVASLRREMTRLHNQRNALANAPATLGNQGPWLESVRTLQERQRDLLDQLRAARNAQRPMILPAGATLVKLDTSRPSAVPSTELTYEDRSHTS